MKNFKYEDIIYNNYIVGKKITFSLTKEYSHEVNIVIGQGSFNIGVKGIDENCIDAWVDKDDKINWNAFNKCETIFQPHISKSILWPRFLSYTGNDIGFIEWSKTRRIEEFTWKPQRDMKADFTDANISDLSIESDYKLDLSFGANVDCLKLYGDPNNFMIEKSLKVSFLSFYIPKDNMVELYSLPKYDYFPQTENLLVKVDPNGAPFDCSSLLQFPNLKSLHLVGNMTNLSSLKELKHLNKLGLWDMPELSDLPNLNNWKELNKFVARNIEEDTGRRLKEEIKELKKQKKFEVASICKLRNKQWFETEYNLLFSNWDSKKEKKATSACKNCLKEIKSATSKNDIKNAIINFTNKFNIMDDIGIFEADNIYKALCILMNDSPIKLEQDTWLKWYKETNNFRIN